MTDARPADPQPDVPQSDLEVASPGEVRDALPADLQPDVGAVEYEFPDNSRRRVQGVIYLAFALGAALIYVFDRESPIVNRGWLLVALALVLFGLYAISAGWRMRLDEKQALVDAQRSLGFAVGYASAQQVWRGWRSKPTWRVLCYSTEDPPTRRGLVTVDAVDGTIIEQLVQPADPDEWKS